MSRHEVLRLSDKILSGLMQIFSVRNCHTHRRILGCKYEGSSFTKLSKKCVISRERAPLNWINRQCELFIYTDCESTVAGVATTNATQHVFDLAPQSYLFIDHVPALFDVVSTFKICVVYVIPRSGQLCWRTTSNFEESTNFFAISQRCKKASSSVRTEIRALFTKDMKDIGKAMD